MIETLVLALFTLQMAYLGLFIFSAVFALLAFVFGHDHDADHDVDHEVGGHELGEGMPSVFSSRVLSLFLMGFSGAGLIATYGWEASAGMSVLAGLGAGVVLGGVAYAFIAVFYREQASSMPESPEYVGLQGRVTSNIPAGGAGEIAVTVRGQLKTVFASTADGSALSEGHAVTIVSMSGGTATVKPA